MTFKLVNIEELAKNGINANLFSVHFNGDFDGPEQYYCLSFSKQGRNITLQMLETEEIQMKMTNDDLERTLSKIQKITLRAYTRTGEIHSEIDFPVSYVPHSYSFGMNWATTDIVISTTEFEINDTTHF